MAETRADTVIADGGRVWIADVADARIGADWDALLRALYALLVSRGEKVTLDALMAHSGDAFNLCHASNWQAAASLCVPTDTVTNAAAAFGYRAEALDSSYIPEGMDALPRDERLDVTRAALERIYAEIDAGRPVLVGGAEEHCERWSIVVGYDREQDLLCHIGDADPYRWTPISGVTVGTADDERGYWTGCCRGAVRDGFVGGWVCNPAFLIGERSETPPERLEMTLSALRRGVELHAAAKHHVDCGGGIDYFFGAEAYEQWARSLETLDYPADLHKPLPDGARGWYAMGNMGTQVDQIMRGRAAAAEFCRYATVLMRGRADHLLAAADAYDRECAVAAERLPAFTEGTEQNRVEWLKDARCRREGAEAVRAMLEDENAAVADIRCAVETR
ncbi:MAG TPA: hypothetical protein DGT21_24125 [Armatimonadetes bacterium]|jgi:hypothetical protein|nr:hypothetical protein [Armatimonadota bacterium]